MKKHKGAALVMVLCIFCVLSIFGVIVTTLTMNNATFARKQKERIQAYYLVLAGIEMGTSAALTPQIVDGLEVKELLYQYSRDPGKAPLTHEETFEPGDRRVTLTIKAVDREGNPAAPGMRPNDVWVEIAAVGTITNEMGSTSHAGSIRISTADPGIIIRQLENPAEV